MTTIVEHNHPPMQTCPEGCPTMDGGDLHVYKDPDFKMDEPEPEDVDTPVDSEVDSPAPDSESAQVSDPAEGDTPVDTSGDNPDPEWESAKDRKSRVARERRAAKKAETAPPPSGEEVKDAVEKTAAKKTTKARGNNRASGKPAATEEGEKSADELTSPPEEKVVDVEREEWFRSPGFQRMKTEWSGSDKTQMDRVQSVIDNVVLETFQDAYAVMSDLYDLVREPMIQEGGEIQTDAAGFTMWARNPLTGAYYEDWSKLTIREREHFLFRITTALFDWEQRAADLWTRAMFSKGMFVEKFSLEYDAPISGTIDDRNARGNVEASEDRYFALMNSAVSRKADALVRAMTNLQLRLKDTLGQ